MGQMIPGQMIPGQMIPGQMIPGKMIPGEISGPDGVMWLNQGATVLSLMVVNGGDRPVQVGSHYHFAESNPALRFDRDAARGHRLDIPAGTSVRFEPGIERMVALIPLGGDRIVAGLRGEVAGPLDQPATVVGEGDDG